VSLGGQYAEMVDTWMRHANHLPTTR